MYHLASQTDGWMDRQTDNIIMPIVDQLKSDGL